MKRFATLCALLVAVCLAAPAAHAQTALTAACPTNPTTPCLSASWTNTSMAAAVATNSSGQETAGPGTAEIWGCIGTVTSTQCVSTMMPPVAGETPPQGSAWVLLGTIAQTQSAGAAGVPNLNWGTMYQLAVRNLWTGGTPSAFSNVFQVQINPMPVTRPAAAAALAGAVVYPPTS